MNTLHTAKSLALASMMAAALLAGCVKPAPQKGEAGPLVETSVSSTEMGSTSRQRVVETHGWQDSEGFQKESGETSPLHDEQPVPQAAKAPPKAPPKAEGKGTVQEIGKNVWLEIDGDKRRVLINAVVCQREVPVLEQFMCRKMTNEHEAILAADCDARLIHAALLAANAEPGSPVKFKPKYTPPTGTVIRVYLRYEDKGKTIKVPARSWIRDMKTKKELEHDWVFAGSMLFDNILEPDGPPIYAANEGNVICLRNLPDALLDLPMVTSQDYDNLDFEAFTERIPPLNTPVLVILEPVLPAKKN